MRRLSTFSQLYPDPRQDFGSASPLFSGCTSLSAFCRDVYRESSGEVLPKFYLGPGQTMENVPDYASADCPVNVASVTVQYMLTTNA